MALVGSSGAGKTTLCSLIPRFYDVTGGCIRVDGKDVRKVTLKSLRDHIGMVQQDVYLFAGTIFENIRYGKPDATREEVIAAAKNANAHEFIMAFPDGYDTDIGQRGIKLSGGQKQRLSIARAIAKHPKIYLFDDSFSALDYKTDVALRRALKAETGDATVIIVAQRISTVLHANQILVLEDGRIVGKGTHAQLMETNGLCLEEYRDFLRQGPRSVALENGRMAQVFYVPAAGAVTEVEVPEGCCQISGDNVEGFILTWWGDTHENG